MFQNLPHILTGLASDISAKSDGSFTDSVLDDFVYSIEGTAAYEQDIGGINLNEFLMGVLTAALRRNTGNCSLQYLQQCLLYTFSRNIPGN